jgi:hypothetical protein
MRAEDALISALLQVVSPAIAARGNDERIEFPDEPLSQVEALWSTHLRREAR